MRKQQQSQQCSHKYTQPLMRPKNRLTTIMDQLIKRRKCLSLTLSSSSSCVSRASAARILCKSIHNQIRNPLQTINQLQSTYKIDCSKAKIINFIQFTIQFEVVGIRRRVRGRYGNVSKPNCYTHAAPQRQFCEAQPFMNHLKIEPLKL